MKQENILSTALKDFPAVDHSRAMHLFTDYYRELVSWNQKINLISRNDEHRIITRHFLESLGFLKHFEFPLNASVLDLGSGAGFPGIPLAIIRPDLHITLVEATKKKAEFLQEISRKLSLNTIRVKNRRMEEITETLESIHIIVCRSVASLSKLYRWSRPCLEQSGGRLVTVKGEQYKKELTILLKQIKPDRGIEYTIKSFDPFPDLYSIRQCYLVIINFRGRNNT